MSQLMGDRIKQCRLRAHMTQEELGNRLGVQKSAIRKYEKGVVDNIPRSRIALMADLFGVDPVWLMGFEDEEYNPDGIDSKEIRLMQDVADTFGNAARDCLIRFYKLDDVDQGKVIERMDTMLEADKYQKDEELQAN